MGESPLLAAERGGEEVSMAVLAATLTSSIVFFPVTFLYGVSRFLFSALALTVVLALVASYFVAMTVVPLFCARFLRAHTGQEGRDGQDRLDGHKGQDRLDRQDGLDGEDTEDRSDSVHPAHPAHPARPASPVDSVAHPALGRGFAARFNRGFARRFERL